MKKFNLIALMIMLCGVCAAQESANLLHLDDSSFDKVSAGKLIIVDFYADWCGPCKRFAPIFAAAAADMPDCTFVKINVDKSPKLSAKYDIRFIPYIVAVSDGKVIAKYNMTRSTSVADFSKWVRKIIKQQE